MSQKPLRNCDTQIEYDIVEWLITNKNDLQELITKSYASQCLFKPSELPEAYTEGVLDIIRKEVEKSMSISPETLALTINEESIKILYGEEFFKKT